MDFSPQRQFIRATFDHTDVTSQRKISTLLIKGTLKKPKASLSSLRDSLRQYYSRDVIELNK
jgi:hypothetical protein